jgi:steroid 5-alpha reductase family enzyme
METETISTTTKTTTTTTTNNNNHTTFYTPPPHRRSRIFLLSNVVDILYSSFPAPFFVIGGDKFKGELSPNVMMNKIDGRLLVGLSMLLTCGLVAFGYISLGPSYGIAAFIPVAVHWFLFLFHALPQHSEKYFDLAGQIGFSSMLFYVALQEQGSLSIHEGRKLLTCILCFIWSFRLGWFLFTRMLERGDDFRFIEARNRPGFHFFTWTSQGMWCFMQGLSVLALLKSKSSLSPPLLTLTDVIGIIVWCWGIFIESLADSQKLAFVRRFPNRTKRRPYIHEGVWSYSQHANFCGETTCWIGICILSYAGIAYSPDLVQISIIAPIFSAMFLMQTTVPWLDVLADRKYAHGEYSAAYGEYKNKVSSYWVLPHRPLWI